MVAGSLSGPTLGSHSCHESLKMVAAMTGAIGEKITDEAEAEAGTL